MLKDIKNFEGLYAVNEDGQVWSYRSNKFLKPYGDTKGYLKVSLHKDGTCYRKRVHRLVLETFNPVEGMEMLDCNHINEEKHDNRLCNLNWLDHKTNVNWGTGIERSAYKRGKPVAQYNTNDELIENYKTISEASRVTGISASRISKVCNNKANLAGGYKWRFIDG